MKKLLLILVVILVVVGIYWYVKKDDSKPVKDEKVAALVSKRHSDGFNSGIDSLMNAYFEIKDAFVDADSSKAKAAASKLVSMTDSSRMAELKTDAAGIYESAIMQLNDVRSNAESLVAQKGLTDMRQDFRGISESIYPLLKTIHYEGKMLYWQNCPMAFGEDKGANWVSNTYEVVNPYLGKQHPEYKGTMLHCGEVKDSIRAQ